MVVIHNSNQKYSSSKARKKPVQVQQHPRTPKDITNKRNNSVGQKPSNKKEEHGDTHVKQDALSTSSGKVLHENCHKDEMLMSESQQEIRQMIWDVAHYGSSPSPHTIIRDDVCTRNEDKTTALDCMNEDGDELTFAGPICNDNSSIISSKCDEANDVDDSIFSDLHHSRKCANELPTSISRQMKDSFHHKSNRIERKPYNSNRNEQHRLKNRIRDQLRKDVIDIREAANTRFEAISNAKHHLKKVMASIRTEYNAVSQLQPFSLN